MLTKPCGSGTAAIMANRLSKGLLKETDTFENYSIVGSKFTAKIDKIEKLNDKVFITPIITGSV